MFKVSSNVNISDLLKTKEPPTMNYLSETTALRMKRFNSQIRAKSTINVGAEKTESRGTRYQESGDKRSKTGMGNY